MTLSIFPDVNVWLTLTYQRHVHFQIADDWYNTLDESCVIYFSRQTQLGLFRLLTNVAVMQEHAYTQRDCWQYYEEWMVSGRAKMMPEPFELEKYFIARTSYEQSSTKEWADAYLAAFAESAGLQLVTFDKVLAGKAKGSILLA